MRNTRRFALGAAALALGLLLGACGSGGSGSSSSGAPIAAKLTLGAPPECPKAPYCLPALKKVYGIKFAKFVPLQAGATTVAAIRTGKVDVGELFSTDPSITQFHFVLLKDDKNSQAAGNIVPVIRKDVDNAEIDKLLNALSTKVTTSKITQLVEKVAIQKQDPAAVAKSFLTTEGLLGGSSGSGKGSLTVGVSGAFPESQIMAEMYAQVLQNAGYTVNTQLNLASRQVSDAALLHGDIDLKPEYVAYELALVDPKANASGPASQVLPRLKAALAKKGVDVLNFTPANDTNAFVVTQQTASKYHLSTISDLAKSAS